MDNWRDYVRQNYVPGKYGTERLARDTGVSRIAIRRFLEMDGQQAEREFGQTQTRQVKQNAAERPVDASKTILDMLRKGATIETISGKTGLTERIARAHIADLRDGGYCIDEMDDWFALAKTCDHTVQNRIEKAWSGEKILRFGVVSDPHVGSKYAQYTLLHRLYDTFKSEGIDISYCPGDMTEGYRMRPGHEHEVHAHGADEQVDWACKVWPDNGIPTEFICGNHDLAHIKNGGIDVGKQIASRRKDMHYLGMMNARVQVTPGCTIELNHPLDGASYALSYAPQKTIDAMSGGDKPSILLNGHHHKAFYLFYRNIHAIECGTMEAQTPWMLGKRIAANVGGWIIEIHVNEEGEVTRFMPEFIPYYKTVKDDWRNFL